MIFNWNKKQMNVILQAESFSFFILFYNTLWIFFLGISTLWMVLWSWIWRETTCKLSSRTFCFSPNCPQMSAHSQKQKRSVVIDSKPINKYKMMLKKKRGIQTCLMYHFWQAMEQATTLMVLPLSQLVALCCIQQLGMKEHLNQILHPMDMHKYLVLRLDPLLGHSSGERFYVKSMQ